MGGKGGKGGWAFNNFFTAKGGTIFICNYYRFFLGGVKF